MKDWRLWLVIGMIVIFFILGVVLKEETLKLSLMLP